MGELHRWLQQLPADDRRRAEQIATALRDLGCDDPQGWAGSEVSEGIPQLARYRLLRSIRPEMIDAWEDGDVPGVCAGVDGASWIARAAAYETAFAMLSLLACGEPAEDLPTWALEEIDPRGQPTGRHLEGLEEDLLGLDPSGREGRDLWR